MDGVLDDFKQAWANGNGYALADTLSPIEPTSNPDRLLNFWRSTNHASARRDIETFIFYGNKFSRDEGQGWVDVYAAYWEAIGEILNMEDSSQGNRGVSLLSLYFMRLSCNNI